MVLISCDLLDQKPLDYEAKEVDMQIFDVKSTCLNAMTTLNILYGNNRLPAHVGHFLIPSFIELDLRPSLGHYIAYIYNIHH